MNPILMRIVVWTVVFLDTASDDEIDPDAAVNQLEWIGSELQKLDAQERGELLRFISGETDAELRSLNRPNVVQRLRSFFDDFGLDDNSSCG